MLKIENKKRGVSLDLDLRIDDEIMASCPDCRIGFLLIRDVTIVGASPGLSQEFIKLQNEVAKLYNVEELTKLPPIMAVRSMYKKLDFDPSRCRPASEVLVRRVIQKKGVYFVNSAVEASNFCSLRYLIPFGLYDFDKIEGDVVYRKAQDGTYLHIGGNQVSTEGEPFLADSVGVFGNPISDSRRTAVSLATKNLLSVVYAGSETTRDDLEEILNFAGDFLTRYNGGIVHACQIV